MITHPHAVAISGTNAAVTAGATDVVVTQVLGPACDRILFEVANTGQNLDAFDVQVQAVYGGTWITLQSTWAATSPTLLMYSGDLAALATGSAGMACLRVFGAYAVRFRASAAAATTSVTVKGTAFSAS